MRGRIFEHIEEPFFGFVSGGGFSGVGVLGLVVKIFTGGKGRQARTDSDQTEIPFRSAIKF
jgi:hypothetical protein